MPIMVGGNGRNVTWRLAAKYADELNLDNISIDEMDESLAIIRQRCEEIGRDPSTLSVSVHVWWQSVPQHGQAAVDFLAGYAEKGVSRVIALIRDSVNSDDTLAQWADDARTAGVQMFDSTAIGA